MPLSARHTLRRQFECVLVAVLSNAVADNDQRIADRARDGQDFEIRLGKIAEVVEIVHLVLNKKKGVFGIVGRRGRANHHAGCVRAVSGHAVRSAGVAAECSQVGDGKTRLGAETKNAAD